MQFGQLKQGLKNLENWEHAWLSVVVSGKESENTTSNAVQRLEEVKIATGEGLNFHTAVCKQYCGEESPFTWNFCKQQMLEGEQVGVLDLILVKVLQVIEEKGIVVVESTEDLTQVQILDFKVYHTIVESIQNLKK